MPGYAVREGDTFVAVVAATDPDEGDLLAISIDGGPDADMFRIDSEPGDTQLRFLQVPDF